MVKFTAKTHFFKFSVNAESITDAAEACDSERAGEPNTEVLLDLIEKRMTTNLERAISTVTQLLNSDSR